ncbi:alpha/beta fold hydrolase [Kribbella sp. NPDC051587]|uniref:alpha/beta fold hydrolase n=1 Tax=Kribbella sp. NPDC051587 TaxID=3364119 RepID=UPI0037952139
MQLDNVKIHGDSGPPVLLLPGGAESCDGFFPGIVEGLVTDPGCRVIVHDRPGTGTSSEPGRLADATAHLHALINELGLGPVVVVGQSLGGAVALLLADDHPESVAGLVLIDPTPINDPRSCARIERLTSTLASLGKLPVLRSLVAATFRAAVARSTRNRTLRPDCAAVFERTAHLDIAQLGHAVHGLADLSAALDESTLPVVPAILITADRKPAAPVAQAHARLAVALNATIESWPTADHNAHLTHPDETLATIRSLITNL